MRRIVDIELFAAAMVLFAAGAARAVSIETHSNPVPNGRITVAAGDADRSAWDTIPAYEIDPLDDAGPELDYVQVQVANDASNLYLRFLLNDITPGDPQFFDFRQVFW